MSVDRASAIPVDRHANGLPGARHLGVTVIVPSYKREPELSVCLEGIRGQRHTAEAVVVVVNVEDPGTVRMLEALSAGWPSLSWVTVERHGLVAALNRGLAAVRTPIVTFIDDDAVPAPDWLERIVAGFDPDLRIAGIGGRDVIHIKDGVLGDTRNRVLKLIATASVGQIQWFGRMTGNHHCGAGPARDVDVLKGVNMSFRTAVALEHGFDERLRGKGAEVHSELSICLPLRRRGFRIVYDPAIVVDHYPAPRTYGYQRDDPRREPIAAETHNETLQVLEYLGPAHRLVYGLWGVLIGTSIAPGVALLLRELARGNPAAWSAFVAAQRGRTAAWSTRRAESRHVPRALDGRVTSTPATQA